MKFHRRKMLSSLVVANAKGKPWFAHSTWKKLEPHFRHLVEAFRPLGTPQLLSEQDDAHGKTVKLGRLSWDETQWTVPDSQLKTRRFRCMELWVPGIAACTRRDDAPDLYVRLQGYHMHELSFTQALLVAYGKDADVGDADEAVRAFVNAAVATSKVELVAQRDGPWAKGNGASFGNGLGYLLLMGVTDRLAPPYKESQIPEGGWKFVT